MKKSVTSYCFDRKLKSGELDLLQCVLCAAETGFDAIEFTDFMPPEGYSEREYAAVLREEADKNHIEISAFSVGAELLRSDGTVSRDAVERVKSKVDVAAALGCRVMRHDVTRGFAPRGNGMKGFFSVKDRLAGACREITLYAAEKGVRTCVENHGFFCQDSDRVESLVNAVGNDNFGVLLDVGNFLCVDEDPVCAAGRLAPYAFNVHIKDFIVKDRPDVPPDDAFFMSRGGKYLLGTVPGHGSVPVAACVRALKRAGYDGYLTLEFEGREELFYALESGLKYIENVIKQQ